MIKKILYRMNIKLAREYPRPAIKFIKKTFENKELIGAEIGVYTGGNARSMLNTLNIKKLYLIDPYTPYGDTPCTRLEEAKQKAIKNTNKFKETVIFIEKFSHDAVKEIPDLDFVYIDGNHDYEYVKEDIESYYPEIKKGGTISGHDFNEDNPRVIKAVSEFAVKNNLNLFVNSPDWWFKI